MSKKKDPLSLYSTDAYSNVHDLTALKPFPTMMVVMASSHCNLKCRMCPRESKVPRRRKNGLGNGHMAPVLFRKIAEEAGKQPDFIGFLFALYGEPLMNPHIVDLVKLVKQNGKKVQITTNGVFLDEKMIVQLIDAGVDKIKLSFQGTTQEEYEFWRRKGSYETIVKNLHALLDIRERMESGIYVQIGTSVCGDSDDDIIRFLDYWEPLVDDIYYDYTGLSHVDRKATDYRKYTERFEAPIRAEKCFDLFTRLNILYNGEVAFCVDDEDIRIGDLKTQSVAEIWMSEERMAHRRKILEKGNVFAQCAKCYTGARPARPGTD